MLIMMSFFVSVTEFRSREWMLRLLCFSFPEKGKKNKIWVILMGLLEFFIIPFKREIVVL